MTASPELEFGIDKTSSKPKSLRQTGWRTSAPPSFHWPIRRSVPRFPACPDHLPVVATGVRVGVQITGRNRQHFNGWNTRVRGAHNSVNQKIIKFGHFTTVGALHFYLTARVVVAWHWVRPDHAEMMFAIGAHKRIVAWHWNSCIVD